MNKNKDYDFMKDFELKSNTNSKNNDDDFFNIGDDNINENYEFKDNFDINFTENNEINNNLEDDESNNIEERNNASQESISKSNKKSNDGIIDTIKYIIIGIFANTILKKLLPLLIILFMLFFILIIFISGFIHNNIKEETEDIKDKSSILDKITYNVKSSLGINSNEKEDNIRESDEDKSKNKGSILDFNKKKESKQTYQSLTYIGKPLDSEDYIYKVFSSEIIPLNDDIYNNIYNLDKDINVILKINVAMKGKEKSYYNLDDFRLKTWYSYTKKEFNESDLNEIKKDIRATESSLYLEKGIQPIKIGSETDNSLGDGLINKNEIESGYVMFKIDREYYGDYILEFRNNGNFYSTIIKYGEIK